MKTQFKKHVQFIVLIALVTFTINGAIADDLTPPDYRGDPLSVHAHWQLVPGTNYLDLTAFNWVDDADPTTTLHPLPVSTVVFPNPDTHSYDFEIPNIIDKLPIKYLRLQLTWIGVLDSVVGITTGASDDGDSVLGVVADISPVLPVDPATGTFYQYYDIEYRPNPDFERIQVQLLPNSYLIQTVVDSVSTVPEPATLSMLALGGLSLLRRKRQ